MSMYIRRYQLGEETALWALFYNTVHTINAQDYSTEQLAVWASVNRDMASWSERLKNKNPFVVMIDHTIVGFAELANNGYIDCFYTAHQWQRKGIGSALLNHIEHEALAMGIRRLFTESSITALPFFKAKGFSIIQAQMIKHCGIDFKNYAMEKIIVTSQQ
ncbi:MAG TPA: GNAT family N-acetyltransferase [Thiothrix sp.]|nr:GNAT family N-acetyltransferase [Thiothrix sp.]